MFLKCFAVGVFFCLQLTIDDTMLQPLIYINIYTNTIPNAFVSWSENSMDAIGYFIHNNIRMVEFISAMNTVREREWLLNKQKTQNKYA